MRVLAVTEMLVSAVLVLLGARILSTGETLGDAVFVPLIAVIALPLGILQIMLIAWILDRRERTSGGSIGAAWTQLFGRPPTHLLVTGVLLLLTAWVLGVVAMSGLTPCRYSRSRRRRASLLSRGWASRRHVLRRRDRRPGRPKTLIRQSDQGRRRWYIYIPCQPRRPSPQNRSRGRAVAF